MRVREAAMIPALVAALIQFLLPFFTDMTPQLAAAVNGGLGFVAALITAFAVAVDKGLALIAGSGNLIIQLAAGFGIAMTDAQQATLATVLTLLVAAFTRTQVVAPVAAAPVKAVAAPQSPTVVQR
jgi:hypothetical protein